MAAPNSQPSQGSPLSWIPRITTLSKSWAVTRALGSRQQPGSMAVPDSNTSLAMPRLDITSRKRARYSAETEYSAGSIFSIVMAVSC